MTKLPPLHLRALELAEKYRSCEADLLDVLQAIDQEKIYLGLGYPSLFQYAVRELRLSESQAYAMMTVSRKAKEIPRLKEEIQSGALTLSKARRIVPVLKVSNQNEWIEKAKTLPKADLERAVTEVNPEAYKRPEVVRALSPDKVGLRLEIRESTMKKLRRAQSLLMTKRRKTLNLEDCLEEILEVFLRKNDPLQLAPNKETPSKEVRPTQREERVSAPSRQILISRNLPVKLKREIHQRESGKCSFKSSDGRICGAESFLQVHHLRPWSQGGSHAIDNLQILCSAHHRWKHRGG